MYYSTFSSCLLRGAPNPALGKRAVSIVSQTDVILVLNYIWPLNRQVLISLHFQLGFINVQRLLPLVQSLLLALLTCYWFRCYRAEGTDTGTGHVANQERYAEDTKETRGAGTETGQNRRSHQDILATESFRKARLVAAVKTNSRA